LNIRIDKQKSYLSRFISLLWLSIAVKILKQSSPEFKGKLSFVRGVLGVKFRVQEKGK